MDWTIATQKARATYNAARDFFDDPANSYWDRYGRATIRRLELQQGSMVLDVACGSGASALRAANEVGPEGRVLGVDVAEDLIDLARTKARFAGLQNIEFVEYDMTQLHFADNSFDAIVCVFGIFFVPDMEGLIAKLWRMLKPSGQLAVTTWGAHFFEPMYGVFFDAVRYVRPDLLPCFRPWDRITTVHAVRRLLREGGTANIRAEAEQGRQQLIDKDAWWRMVLGSGLRATVEAIGPELAKQVRLASLAYIEENRISSVASNVIYAVAQKPRHLGYEI